MLSTAVVLKPKWPGSFAIICSAYIIARVARPSTYKIMPPYNWLKRTEPSVKL